MSTFRGWAVTIRPADGLTDEMVTRAMTCFAKLDGAYAVTEKLGHERHLHAALFFGTAVRKCQVLERAKVIQGEMSKAELHVLKMGIKIIYNDEFVTYLKKGDDTVVLMDRLPAEVAAYYPSEESQAKAMASAGMGTEMLISMYRKSQEDVTVGRVWDFMRDLWFEKRILHPPRSTVQQIDKVMNLFEMLRCDMTNVHE